MYSDKKSVLQLTALLKAHGITHVVISPGSRNAPLTHSFTGDSDFTCYSVVDERSAGFFALGVAQAEQQPVAVCCTSGTAALNLGPAVAEAYYQQLPLLVITADRPQAWIGQKDGQTIPQDKMFGTLVHHSVQLPEGKDAEEEWHCNRLINEAILSLDKDGSFGPSHINIPLSEPLFSFGSEHLPQVRVIRRSKTMFSLSQEQTKEYVTRFCRSARKMIIVGQLPPGHGLTEPLQRLAEEQGVAVLADRLSNLPSGLLDRFDVLLRTGGEEMLQALAPELVITLGGHLTSKRLKQFIRKAEIRDLWHLTPSGEMCDTFQKVTDLIRCEPAAFLQLLAATPAVTGCNQFRHDWINVTATITPPKASYSDLSVTGCFLEQLPEEATLHLANSQAVYLTQLFDLPAGVELFCNRGTNGIEGSLSTAVGYAAASGRLTFLLTGDMSFFYDMNALWNRHLSPNLRILLNNNGGGGIFHTLPGLNRSQALNDYVAAAHHTEARRWAEQQGFRVLTARNSEELQQQLPLFMNREGEQPVLLEVFTSMEENRKVIQSYYEQLKHHNK
ncbi:MAG: 2-succinyl-5-enolpyruvyl-6-hydroxy-3-cyclohexene-1-carboxylic-acid synthase [Proteiniphilum sp.]|jgi:2-succinyl-5-enolpyruvyl-6-hydroxy-3-cyclohexene-1-carboxylate synthase|nr:2-succinyl-5-enolpyruvyl-6-hydroxy-3-cyclohexene-1-carboxylic-acid synthase [Proteiniphilum sp.]MDD3555844.1 2-succinyl-5-enolpyruvyl-6-hydroxy-3-cyclohexene-1-carboxylic-acid synthase [Proteiniphilum sp.]MDD4485735.1 2-succinyl-5-enolpyruvyl-6-hydroxy-3-cyclohexene-1-carboxylic-acid synthase [Proteiniphilum sp.]MDY0182790.1 2-succinyl-5-enolpyruvyl-6-hydroxy-3-cyclohexene-1-carboxylic-acid synthase [Proteiniphilum sp.]